VEAVLIGLPDIAPHYQLVVERRGSLDHVTVEVEAQAGVWSDSFPVVARKVAHGGQRVPRPQSPRGDELPHGLLDLAPEGSGERGVDADSGARGHVL